MKNVTRSLAVVVFVALFGGTAVAAQKGPVETVTDGCKKELETFCKGVSPGEGRILACLYAFEDKLSNRCDFALYDASVKLERAINALTYAATECRDDLATLCSGVQPGQGRLIDCLDKKKDQVSARCRQAIADVGLK